MKHYEIRMRIKPTDIKYGGFRQSYNKFQNYTFVKADDFEAETWREAAEILTDILGGTKSYRWRLPMSPPAQSGATASDGSTTPSNNRPMTRREWRGT